MAASSTVLKGITKRRVLGNRPNALATRGNSLWQNKWGKISPLALLLSEGSLLWLDPPDSYLIIYLFMNSLRLKSVTDEKSD